MVEVLNKHTVGNTTPKSEIILTYKKLKYLRRKGLKWGGEKLTNESIAAWRNLIDEDAEAMQMDYLAGLYFKNDKFEEETVATPRQQLKNTMCEMKSNSSAMERLQFLRIFGFLPGNKKISSEELNSWENLVELDVEAAQLDKYADQKIREFK